MAGLAKLALAGTVLLGSFACQKSQSSSPQSSPVDARLSQRGDPTSQDYSMPPLPHARVILRDAYGAAHAVDAEVAANDAATTRGLMWRSHLAEGQGMLFIFPDERVRSFWMRNTLISLDMIFIGKDKAIAGIVRQATPKTLALRSVEKPTQYVLEVPGGWSEKNGIQSGSRIEIEGTSMIDVRP